MLKSSSALSRLLWQFSITILAITAVYFAMSSYYFSDTYIGAHQYALEYALEQGRDVLERYAAGGMTREEIRGAANPVMSVDSGFFMLLDADGQELACTESAATYFTGDAYARLLEQLRGGGSAVARVQENGGAVLMMGEKTAYGSVIAGRQLRVFWGSGRLFARDGAWRWHWPDSCRACRDGRFGRR